MTIKVVHEFPPIPDRRWDWRAYHEGEEEQNHCGWGRTREEALADLERLDEEQCEANEERYAKWLQGHRP
jgi:hypothetical protein